MKISLNIYKVSYSAIGCYNLVMIFYYFYAVRLKLGTGPLQMNAKKEVTIYDIAKRLKLSASTVSRGLNDHSDISKETIRKSMSTAPPGRSALAVRIGPSGVLTMLDCIGSSPPNVQAQARRPRNGPPNAPGRFSASAAAPCSAPPGAHQLLNPPSHPR